MNGDADAKRPRSSDIGKPRRGSRSADKLIVALRALGEPRAKEALLPISVREIAIALMHSEAAVRLEVCGLLPPPKAELLKSEVRFLAKLDVSYAQFAAIVDKVVGLLHGVGDLSHRSYIRPKKF